jgi:hypothetical protein
VTQSGEALAQVELVVTHVLECERLDKVKQVPLAVFSLLRNQKNIFDRDG